MGILIGMDEAGYGPNLGPLVVAATAWEVLEEGSGFRVQGSEADKCRTETRRLAQRLDSSFSEDSSATAVLTPKRRTARKQPQISADVDLYRRLRNIVAKSPSDRRVPIADSKVLYNPAAGLRQLERGLHAVLQSIGQSLSCWSEMVRYCQADPDGHHRRVCWPDEFDCTLPVGATAEELSRLAARFARACETVRVQPLFIRARLIFPEQFNDLVAKYSSKGAALSHVTVGLLREVMDILHRPAQAGPPSQFPTHVVCDKHGGRNFYTALLQHHFSEHWVAPVYENHSESRYEWGPDDARVRVTFRVNGEAFLPTALASMTAKYLRELAMRAFNEYWCARVPDLRPTAGYAGDSRRFKKAIEAKQRELGINDHCLWRSR